MDTIIREIIEADRLARERIEQANQDKFHIQKTINVQRDEIIKNCMASSQKEIQQYRDEMKQQIEQAKLEQEAAYQKSLLHLSERYQDKKEVWIDELFNRCLHG